MAGIIAVVLSNIIWGIAPAVFKVVLRDAPPFTLAFIRFFCAGLIFLPFAIVHYRSLSSRQKGHIILGAVWGISVNITCFFIGLPYAPSIYVNVISALSPLALYFFALIVLKEKPHPQVIRGIVISLIGVFVIIGGPLLASNGLVRTDGESYSVFSILFGCGMFFLSMIGGVLYSIHLKKISGEVNSAVITCSQFLIGALTFAPMMFVEISNAQYIAINQITVMGIIYGVFFASALAYYLHKVAISHMTVQDLGVYTYLMPLIGVAAAIPLLGEYPDRYFLIGSAIIALGIWISERHPHFYHVHRSHTHEKVRHPHLTVK